jgi:hypothetical protein
MVLMALFTTFITTPIVMAIYKPARPSVPYKRRTVEGSPSDADSELRVLACFHSNRNVPTLLNLVESSRGTNKRRLAMYAMHLVELSERSSAISMVHRTRRNAMPFFNSGDKDGQMVVAFEAFQQLSTVRVKPMTAISDLETIHRDVIDSAAEKRAAIVIMPYHKMLQHDGTFHSLGSQYHDMNKRVLRGAPCTVAILVDRGLGGHSQVSAKNVAFSVSMLFFGGPDDREALAYAMRMAEHPGVAVTLTRFRPSRPPHDQESDEAAVEAFKARVGGVDDGSSVRFDDSDASGKKEVLEAINSLSKSNMFVVGRMPPTEPLVERPEELGPVGSYLASPEFKTSASVLVIKRYDPATNPASKRFDPKARPPVATDVENDDVEELGGSGRSASVVPVQWTPSHDSA